MKCDNPCRDGGKFVYCNHDSGKYSFKNCKRYKQKPITRDDHTTYDESGLTEMIIRRVKR